MSEKPIGIILSEASSKEAACQLLEEAERGQIREGMLVVVQAPSGGHRLLARVAEIVPFNAFYTEGDPWSEARRKGLPLPEDIARQYEVGRLELLVELGKGGDITNPPRPGDRVFKYDPRENELEVFGVGRNDPGYLWYGTQVGYKDAPVPLDVEQLPTHVAIFGVTGSGKSFDTGALIEQLSRIPVEANQAVSYPLLIIDAHGDYLDYVDYTLKGQSLGSFSKVLQFVFPVAYVRNTHPKKAEFLRPIGLNLRSDNINSRDLAEIISQFYKGSGGEVSELMVHGIAEALQQMEVAGYDCNDLFTTTFGDLQRQIDQSMQSPPTKAAIHRALDKFKDNIERHKLIDARIHSPLADRAFIEDLTKYGQMIVVDFSAEGSPGVDLPTKQMVITYLASMLFDQFTKYRTTGDTRYLLFVLEEAQNFCPDQTYPIGASLAKVKLSAIATQGRKFGLSLCLVSQRPSFVDRIILSMCNTFFIHRVSPEDVSFVKSVTGGLPPSLAPRLTKMTTGEMIITGQMVKVPFPVVVRGERSVQPTVGKTEVLKSLVSVRLGQEQ